MLSKRTRRTNRSLSWWGPNLDLDRIVNYQCPYNLTADSTFNSSSHCPVNSFGPPYDLTSDTILAWSSGTYTTVD